MTKDLQFTRAIRTLVIPWPSGGAYAISTRWALPNLQIAVVPTDREYVTWT